MRLYTGGSARAAGVKRCTRPLSLCQSFQLRSRRPLPSTPKLFDICVEPRLRAPTPARWMKAPNVGDQGRIFAEKRFVPGQTAFSLGTGALASSGTEQGEGTGAV